MNTKADFQHVAARYAWSLGYGIRLEGCSFTCSHSVAEARTLFHFTPNEQTVRQFLIGRFSSRMGYTHIAPEMHVGEYYIHRVSEAVKRAVPALKAAARKRGGQ